MCYFPHIEQANSYLNFNDFISLLIWPESYFEFSKAQK